MINNKLTLTFALGFQLINCYSLKAQEAKFYRLATPEPPRKTRPERKSLRDAFEPPPEEDTPQQTTGGGSRDEGQCSGNSNLGSSLTALVPTNGKGLTMSDRPNLPIYLPATAAENLELSLFDANHQGIYQTIIKIPAEEQIVGIKLPQTAPVLEVGQEYYWSIALICDPSDRLKDWVVKGKVKRIQLDSSVFKQELAAAPPLKRFELYREVELWYEMVATLLAYQQAHPYDSRIERIWRDLLITSELEHLITQQLTIK